MAITTAQNGVTPNLAERMLPYRKGASRRPAPDMGSVVRFKRNETIFDEGDAAQFSYRIISGVIRQCVLLPDGRRQIIDFLDKNDALGLGAEGLHDTRAEAVTDVLLARFPRNASLEASGHASACAVARNLKQQLRRARLHTIMLGRQTVRERVANFLVQLAARETDCLEDDYQLDLPMGRQDIADYLGLTLETVCRMIGTLKREGLIDVPNTHCIVIRRAVLLRDLAQGDV